MTKTEWEPIDLKYARERQESEKRLGVKPAGVCQVEESLGICGRPVAAGSDRCQHHLEAEERLMDRLGGDGGGFMVVDANALPPEEAARKDMSMDARRRDDEEHARRMKAARESEWVAAAEQRAAERERETAYVQDLLQRVTDYALALEAHLGEAAEDSSIVAELQEEHGLRTVSRQYYEVVE